MFKGRPTQLQSPGSCLDSQWRTMTKFDIRVLRTAGLLFQFAETGTGFRAPGPEATTSSQYLREEMCKEVVDSRGQRWAPLPPKLSAIPPRFFLQAPIPYLGARDASSEQRAKPSQKPGAELCPEESCPSFCPLHFTPPCKNFH